MAKRKRGLNGLLFTDIMEASHGIRYPNGFVHEDAVRPVRARIAEAVKYVLDPQACLMAAGVAYSKPSSVLAALEFALLPSDPMWIEFANAEVRAAMASLGSPNLPTGEKGIVIRRSGFLLTAREDGILAEYVHTSGPPGGERTDLSPVRGLFRTKGLDPEARAILPDLSARRAGVQIPQGAKGKVRQHLALLSRDRAEAQARDEIRLRFTTSPHPDMDPVTEGVEALAGPMTVARVMAGQEDEIRRLFADVVLPALILLNCRNAVRSDPVPAPERLNRQRAKKGRIPVQEHVLVRVSLTAGARRRTDGTGSGSRPAGPRSGGIVTGHFKVRQSGVYWWSPHYRGSTSAQAPERVRVIVP